MSASPPNPDSPAPDGAGLRDLLAFTRPYFPQLALALVAMTAGTALGLVLPRLMGVAVDAAFTRRDPGALDRAAAWLAVVFTLQAGAIGVRHYWMSWVGQRVVADLRRGLQAHLLRLPPAFFLARRTGELLSRMSDDAARVEVVVGQDISMLLRSALGFVGSVAILVWISPRLASIMLAVVPLMVVAAAAWGRRLRALGKAVQAELATASGTLGETLGAIEVVQGFTREPHETARYGASVEAAFAVIRNRIRQRAFFMAGTSLMAMAAVAGIFWFGGHMVVENTLSPGDLASFFFYTLAVAGNVGGLAGVFGRVSSAQGATARLFEILREPPAIADPPAPAPLGPVRGAVAFEGVTFTYPGRDAPVIRDLSLAIAPGETCALVGLSGSGKTTLGRMVFRFWDPDAGRVTLDGRDLRDLALADLRARMALVSQDPVLFSVSVRENIRYGRLDADDAAVERAAADAHAAEFIESLPAGYDTRIGERGVMLSGGQRQRLAIARAILRDPRVLVLDEATSALDTESEAIVQAALDRLRAGRTTLVIAHRLSTIRDADRIVVLADGEVVEHGSHDELSAAGGAYSRLVARQSG